MPSYTGQKQGRKLSEYPLMPVNRGEFPNRIIYDSFLFSYAHTEYSQKFINKNFQIPYSCVRRDIHYMMGIDNLKHDYRNLLSLWCGFWACPHDRTASYLYKWSDSQSNEFDYVKDKFRQLESHDNHDNVFLLKTAPIPMEETTGANTATLVPPDGTSNGNGLNDIGVTDVHYTGKEDNEQLGTHKIVTKDYIDNRFNGWRIVDTAVTNIGGKITATIPFRPYGCYYYVDQPTATPAKHVEIVNFTTTVQYDNQHSILDKLKKKRLIFNIRLENHGNYHILRDNSEIIKFKIDGSEAQVKFDTGFSVNSLFAHVSEYYYLRCEAYINKSNKLEILIKSDGNITDYDVPDYDSIRRIKYLKIGEDTQGIRLYEYKNDLYKETFITELKGELDDQGKWNNTGDNHISFCLHDKEISGSTGPGDDDDTAHNWAFDNDKEYTWEFFVKTPISAEEQNTTQKNIDVEWSIDTDSENYDDSHGIMWAMGDVNKAPELKPNKLYCFEFTKLTNGIFIGRIKYFVSLLKKKLQS